MHKLDTQYLVLLSISLSHNMHLMRKGPYREFSSGGGEIFWSNPLHQECYGDRGFLFSSLSSLWTFIYKWSQTHNRQYVAPHPCGFLPFTQKIFRQPIHENSWRFPSFYCRCHYERKKIQKFSFIPAQSTFGTTSTIFFALIKKSSYKPKLKLLNDIINNFLENDENFNFTSGVLGIKIG